MTTTQASVASLVGLGQSATVGLNDDKLVLFYYGNKSPKDTGGYTNKSPKNTGGYTAKTPKATSGYTNKTPQ